MESPLRPLGDYEVPPTDGRHGIFQRIKRKKMQLSESPVNPLIAENLPYIPISLIYFFVVPVLALILYIIGYYTSDNNSDNPLQLFWQLDAQQSAQALGTSVRTTTNVLVLLVSSSGVILQLASNRLFFADKIINAMIAYTTFATVYSTLVVYSSLDPRYIHFHVISSLILLVITILIAFPYFYYLFDWLDPVKIVHLIQGKVLAAITSKKYRRNVNNSKIKIIRNLDYLADIARYEIQANSKGIAFSVVDSIMMICHHYLKEKSTMSDEWFKIPHWLRQTPDFISMSEDLYDELEKQHLWLEFKVFRTLLSLYREGVKDFSFLVTTHTRKLAERAIMSQDVSLLTLCIQFLNTYLRTAISGNQSRIAYTVMDQYRLLCEFMLISVSSEETAEDIPHVSLPVADRKRITTLLSIKSKQEYWSDSLRNVAFKDGTESESQQIEAMLVKVLGNYWPYYHQYSVKCGLDLVAETIAHDQATLLEVAYVCNVSKHDSMLKSVLTSTVLLDKTIGTLRAYIKLAATYIVLGAEEHAREIARCLEDVPAPRLTLVWQQLLAVEDKIFWEINDRLVNFNYITEEQKAALPLFFSFLQKSVISPAEHIAIIHICHDTTKNDIDKVNSFFKKNISK